MNSCPQVFVRARIRFADGSTSDGCAAEMMIPKWFDKNPALSNEDNFQQLRDALLAARAAYCADTSARTAWQHFAHHYEALLANGAAAGLNPLATGYGPALLDRAILDALLLKLGCSFAEGMKSVPYGVAKDFTPISLVAKAPLSVAINKNLPVTDVKSLIAYAKANPGKMTFAVGSIGSAGHLSTELLKRAGGIEYTVVPYKGTAPAFQDLIGGQIDGFIDPILGSLQYHKSGMLRVVAVTGDKRAPSLPDVPTVAETIPGFEFYSWYGLWAPAKLPADIAHKLNAETTKALASDMIHRISDKPLQSNQAAIRHGCQRLLGPFSSQSPPRRSLRELKFPLKRIVAPWICQCRP